MLARLRSLPRPTRLLLAGLLVCSAASLAALSSGPPRLTLLNAALVVDYRWDRGAAAVGCSVLLLLLANVLHRKRARLLLACLALLPLAVGGHLLAYRLEAGDSGLEARGPLGVTRLPWSRVTKVTSGRGAVLVEAEHASISIDTADFSAEQRKTLERALARRVREAGSASVVRVPD